LRKGTENESKSYHKKTHDFFIYDHLNFPLLVENWTAAEELALIQGIMKCGLGNWDDVHEQFLQQRTPSECEEHYFSIVYSSTTSETPNVDYTSVMTKRKPQAKDCQLDKNVVKKNEQVIELYKKRQAELRELEEAEFPSLPKGAPLRHQNSGDPNSLIPVMQQSSFGRGQLNGNTAQRTSGQAQMQSGTGIQKQNCNEVLGYLPKRGDFEQEYDMDAELLLADMEFFDDDTPENFELKNNVIELYNARLDERIRRKKFVIERGLLDLKKVQKFERKKTKEEREIINQMKIFARFNTEEQHQKLVNTLLKERLLKEVIEQLKFFKSKGLTNLAQIEKYIEAQKVKNKSSNNSYDKNYIHQRESAINSLSMGTKAA
jgi:transcriptional adapter 2-alpha